MRRLDEEALDTISQDLSAVVRSAAWGEVEWVEVCRFLTRAFPGSYSAILNQSLDRPEFGFSAYDGIEDTHIRSFFDYYAFLNPWENFWKNARNGAIIVAERDQPASIFRNSEFYVDWMQRVGRYDAAVGMRVGLDRRELIYMPTHYDTRYADRYDGELEFVMKRLRPVLLEAVRMKVQLRDVGESQNAVAALVSRDEDICFVVDQNCHVMEANGLATVEFERNAGLRLRGARVCLASSKADTKLRDACRLLALAPDKPAKLFAMPWGDGQAVVRVTRLPAIAVGGLILGRPQFLVQISAERQAMGPDEGLLREAYDLTAREAKLCAFLGKGEPLQDACALAGISYENGRQRLKVIFQKTSVHSQTDLRDLLRRFRKP